MLLHYSRETWEIQNLLLIPRHLISISAIEKRKPLSPLARRAGWIGCNILLDEIPEAGRIFAIKNGVPIYPERVRSEWKRVAFLKSYEPAKRGWLVDVLACIESLDKRRFTLSEAYGFAEKLSRLHPENRNVKPKIRQQLQVLRDRRLLKFVSRGEYELLGGNRI
jgi:type II restriction enzyme